MSAVESALAIAQMQTSPMAKVEVTPFPTFVPLNSNAAMRRKRKVVRRRLSRAEH
jgi:hypothetical protein